MVIGSILDIFREKDWAGELAEKVSGMLETTAEMFGYAMGVLVHGEPDDDPQGEIYDRDRSINERERDVRRRVVTRLSVGGRKTDIPTALIFMNVVKDVERVGDYVKNTYEVGLLMPDPPDRRLYQPWLQGRAKALEELIVLTGIATGGADEECARDVIQRTRQITTEAEEAIREVTDSTLPTRDAVCLVLILRFFKRIAAHLGNVATAEVRPVDQLDFHDED